MLTKLSGIIRFEGSLDIRETVSFLKQHFTYCNIVTLLDTLSQMIHRSINVLGPLYNM